MSDERTSEEDASARDEKVKETTPTAREAQRPIGPVDADGTWLSGEDEVDPQREEAAERASRAVEPGRPRE
jgi:hypothetical protein